MIDLLIAGADNDLVVTTGDLTLVEASDQINQAIRQALGTFFGEWFLNNTVGVPYFQQIFVPSPNLDLVQANLLNAIQNVPGVVQIQSFAFDYGASNRSLDVSISVMTTNGQTIPVATTVGVASPTNT